MRKLIIILLLFAATASASIFINSFNSGQLSEDMKYRYDLEKTAMGSEELENVLVRPQGMAYKRPGTEFIDTVLPMGPPTPAVPPAAFRPEAYFTVSTDYVYWFDPNWNYLYATLIPDFGNTATAIEQTSDGLVSVVGYGQIAGLSAIARIDVDLNVDEDFFTPAAGWAAAEVVNGLAFDPNEDYLYASSQVRIHKFDTATGAEVWVVSTLGFGSMEIEVDSLGNLYASGAAGQQLRKYDPDGDVIAGPTVVGTASRFIYYDPNNDKLLCGGIAVGAPAYNIVLVDPSDLSVLYTYYDNVNTANGLYYNGYYYVVKAAIGTDGYGVVKLDSELNLVAGHANPGGGIIVDWNNNIAVSTVGSPDRYIYIYDTDLNLLDTKTFTSDQSLYGPELARINYLDAGTPEIPGTPGFNPSGLSNIRLVPFEYSTNDAYVLEFGHEYLSFLRTTP